MKSSDLMSTTQEYNSARALGRWDLIETLLGGTQAMREAGAVYLPMFESEKAAQYKMRIARSFLYTGYEDAVDRITSKPFSEAVSLTGEVPEWCNDIARDVDGRGTPLTDFAKEALRRAIIYGASHVIVDSPRLEGEVSMADESSGIIRPFFVQLNTPDVIWWQTQREGAQERVNVLRWKTRRTDVDGKRLDMVREWIADPAGGGITTLYDVTKEEMSIIESLPHSFARPFVPLASLFAKRTAILTGHSSLVKCADANLEHWQFSSDHKNFSTYAMVPKIKRMGITQEEMDTTVEMTAQSTLDSKNKEATIEWMEGPANILRYGAEERDRIGKRIELLGMTPFFEKVAITVPEALGAKSHSESQVKAWVRALESMLRRCYELAAQWKNVPLPPTFAVNVFSDFEVANGDSSNAAFVDTARARGDLDLPTYINEMKRRGIFSEEVTAENIVEGLAGDLPSGEDTPDDFTPGAVTTITSAGNAAAAAGATLSGVQIQAAMSLVQSYYKNEITSAAAIILLISLGIERADAKAMLEEKLTITTVKEEPNELA